MLASVFRFVPYIGPILAAIVPVVLSIAVDAGWTMLVWTAALFIGVELVTGNVVEPRLYGSMTGLSPLAIVVAAIFWTWLWGPIGLLLSTPLTVCVVVLGRHVPQFTFLNILLGSEPVLSPAESLHQRLLAADTEEATQRAEIYLANHTLEDFYDKVAIPALAAIEHDRAVGVLGEVRRQLAADGMLTLIDNLSGYEDVAAANPPENVANGTGVDLGNTGRACPERVVLCVGARGNLDDVAATILAAVLERRGLKVRVLSFEDVRPARLSGVDTTDARIACLCYMNENSIAHARYLIRRLRRKSPTIPIMVGLWTMASDKSMQHDALAKTGADMMSSSLVDTIEKLSTREALAQPRQ